MGPLPLPLTRSDVEVCGQRRVSPWKQAAAARLYQRLIRRPIALRRPIPVTVREQLAQLLHRDGLVLAATVYADASGRRFTCRAQVFAPQRWWHEASSWMAYPLPGWRLCITQVLWPAPDTAQWRDRFADLAF